MLLEKERSVLPWSAGSSLRLRTMAMNAGISERTARR